MTTKYSFKQVLSQSVEVSDNQKISQVNIDKIVIPKIQRDYAQGRKTKLKDSDIAQLNIAGSRFISEIFSSLCSAKEMELDFVYGSIKNEDGQIHTFYPLDGQQRLTTLFLLYWFVAGVELDINQKKECAEMLKKFSYQTRTSSSKFCENLACELTRDGLNFSARLLASSPEDKEKNKITAQIENLYWFHNAYNLDPTISAMLNMIDKIEELYFDKNCHNIYQNLEKLQFYIIPLNNFGLTEELYVKMNARGKQLSDFENFKADFQEWIKQDSGLQEQNYCGRTMPYDMFIINKIDNEWSQCFWNMLKTEDKNFDPIFLSFFYKYFLNDYIIKFTANNRQLDKQEEFKTLINEEQYLGLSIFNKPPDRELLKNLVVLLDNIYLHYDEIVAACAPCWAKDKVRNVLSEKLELKDRALFGALTLYFVKNGNNFDGNAYNDWMHVVWNIIENSDIDNYAVVAGVIKLIAEMAPYSDNIYKALADDKVQLSSNQSQEIVLEERQKAKLIMSNPEWKQALWQAEGHKFFRGNIGFIIPKSQKLEDFMHNFENASQIFDENGVTAQFAEKHLMLRALVSRYTQLADIKYQITDRDEKEHSLKKMLLSDPVVKEAINSWISLPSLQDINSKLLQEAQKTSQMAGFDKKTHEILYKELDLIDWMQQNNAYRYQNYYISKPHSRYLRIYVCGYLNEIIKKLLDCGWECKNQCFIQRGNQQIAIPYYWFAGSVDVTKVEKEDGKTILLACHFDENHVKLTVGGEEIANLNYLNDVTDDSKVDDFVRKIQSTFKTPQPETSKTQQF